MFKKVISSTHVLRAFLLSNVALSCFSVMAEEQVTDTVHQKKLREVVVSGQKTQASRSALPVQTLSEKEISNLNAYNVADVAKHFAGVTIKDYGGIGGLKTISVRGLGAHHTGVSYDGVMMSDIQSGQIDLSQFCIDNIESVSLDNGQPMNLLQSARMFASSSVLSLNTKLSAYDEKNTFNGKFTIKAGSFGLLNPSLLLEKYLSRKLAIAFATNGVSANGEYPFRFNINPYGKNIIKSTRYNTDVKNIRSELNVIYLMSDKESLKFKANHYYSDRGLPGPVTSYNFNDARGRMNDNNLLCQFHYENKKSNVLQYRFSGKYNRQEMEYTNKSNNYSTLPDQKLKETYLQNEYYLTGSVQYRPLQGLTIAAATDYWFNDLYSTSNLNYKEDEKPIRNTIMSNLSAKYVNERFCVGGNVLFVYASGNADTTETVTKQSKVSPTLFVSYQLFDDKNLTLRAFYKDVYRLPTFTELYYLDLGYKHLSPEKTHQFNVGLSYQTNEITFLSNFTCSVDAYYNQITDKITITYGVPYSTVRNIGKVNVKGMDVNMMLSKDLNKHHCLQFTANYTYQMAQNYDNIPETYGDILPYTPIHSGSASLSYSYRKLDFGYNMLFAGKRYSGQNSYILNYLSPYVEQSIFGRVNYKKISLMAEVINFLDANFEVVKNYPMPGRNFRFSVNYKF